MKSLLQCGSCCCSSVLLQYWHNLLISAIPRAHCINPQCLNTRVTEVSESDFIPGLAQDRHYFGVRVRRWPRPTLDRQCGMPLSLDECTLCLHSSDSQMSAATCHEEAGMVSVTGKWNKICGLHSFLILSLCQLMYVVNPMLRGTILQQHQYHYLPCPWVHNKMIKFWRGDHNRYTKLNMVVVRGGEWQEYIKREGVRMWDVR